MEENVLKIAVVNKSVSQKTGGQQLLNSLCVCDSKVGDFEEFEEIINSSFDGKCRPLKSALYTGSLELDIKTFY